MQDDYATNLMSAQRQLLQQNPSGVSRPELSIGGQLNGFMAPRLRCPPCDLLCRASPQMDRVIGRRPLKALAP
jgi:hypothetical protein